MYGIFFDFEGETIRLPLNTDKFVDRTGNKNKTIEIISLGEVNILKDIGLRDFSFKTLLPGGKLPFVLTGGDFKTPDFYIERFRKYKASKKPQRLIVTRILPNNEEIPGINILISFEDYAITENAGEEGDFWCEIKLKEFRELKSKVISVESENPVTGAAQVVETQVRPSKEPDKEYTVVSGDTLWSIAKRALNDGSRYAEIADLNGIKDPNKIYPGQVLKLPDGSNAVTSAMNKPYKPPVEVIGGGVQTTGSSANRIDVQSLNPNTPVYRGGGGISDGSGAGRRDVQSISTGGGQSDGGGAGRYSSNSGTGQIAGSGVGRKDVQANR